MYTKNSKKNKFSELHQDDAVLVPTSAQGLTNMFQPTIEQLQGTCTSSEKLILRSIIEMF
jgi:hypothetical protein